MVMKFIARFLINRLSANDLIALGVSLAAAGRAAQARQAAISEALAYVRVGVEKLTN